MRKVILITVTLTGLATCVGLTLSSVSGCLSLWSGALWGLLNAWCMTRLIQGFVQGKRGLRLTGWVTLKFLGLYAIAGWLLLSLRVSVVGWLIGFTLSLIGLGLSAFPFLRAPFKVYSWLCLLGLAASSPLAQASEGSHAQAPHAPEIPNFITLIAHFSHGSTLEFLHTWENAIFAFLIVGIVGGAVALASKALALLPSRSQAAMEAIVEGLDDLVCGVLGKSEGRRYLPFLGTLFLFILSMNLAGLVPGFKSPTSRFEMTGALGLCVFAYVQWTGIRRLGAIGYLDHLLGQPRDIAGWILGPIILLPIHIIGELVKPLSLSLRLFGNIMGEDTLLAVFVTLGALCMAWSHLPIGIPLHLPFVFLAIIFSVVQALVFTSLSMIYIYMMLPHESHEEDHSVRGEPVEPRT